MFLKISSCLSGYGVNSVEKLINLTMQDYSAVGIVSMEDRKRDYPGLGEHQYKQPDSKSFLPKPTTLFGKSQYQPQQQNLSSQQQQSISIPSLSDQLSRVEVSERSLKNQSQYSYNNNSSEDSLDLSHTEQPQQQFQNTSVSIKQKNKPRSQNHANATTTPQVQSQQEQEKLFKQNSFPDIVDETLINKKQFNNKRTAVLNAYGIPLANTSNQPVSKGKSQRDLMDRIRVCVRKRPLSKKELKRNETDIATVHSRRSLTINEPKVKVDLTKFIEQHNFVFDEVFDCNCTNEDVYKRTALPLVEYIFTGGKATCFA
ncbi:Kinesin-like protein kif24 [Lobulomyces angularis]|nr:Kinesin-like protein kif24 [Lobulomyces angularis]